MNLGTLTAFTRVDLTGMKAGFAQADTMVATGASRMAGLAAPAAAAFAAVGAAAGAAAAVSVRKFADFEAEMVRVKSIVGASEEEFQRLTKTAKDLGSSTVFTAQQSADAMRALAMAGNSTNTIVSSMPATLQLAQAAMIDIGSAANLATNIMAGFGIQAEDLSSVNDTLVATFTGANVTVEMLAETFKTAGPVAKAAGISFEDLAATAGVLGNAGINASLAGTGLRRAIGALMSPSGGAKKSMDALGLSAQDAGKGFLHIVRRLEKARDGMSRLEFASHLATAFGERAGPQMAALVEQGSDAIEKLNDRIEKSGGLARKMQEDFGDTTAAKFTALSSAVEGLALALGGALAPAAAKLAEDWTLIIQGMMGRFDEIEREANKRANVARQLREKAEQSRRMADDVEMGFRGTQGIAGARGKSREQVAKGLREYADEVAAATRALAAGKITAGTFGEAMRAYRKTLEVSAKSKKKAADAVEELSKGTGAATKQIEKLGRALEFGLPAALRGSGLLNPMGLVARGGFQSAGNSDLFARDRRRLSRAEYDRQLARRMGSAPGSPVGDRPPAPGGGGQSGPDAKGIALGALADLLAGGGASQIASKIGNAIVPVIGGAIGSIVGTAADMVAMLHPVNAGLHLMGAGLAALSDLWSRTRTAGDMQEKSNKVLDKFAEILSQFMAPFEGVLDVALIFADGMAKAAISLGNFSGVAEATVQAVIGLARAFIGIASKIAMIAGDGRMLSALLETEIALNQFASGVRVNADANRDAAESAERLSQTLYNLSDSPGFRQMRYGAETARARGGSSRAAVLAGGSPIAANKWQASNALGLVN